MKKRILGSITAAVLAAVSLSAAAPKTQQAEVSAASSINYAEALQKSLYFYECQQAGPLPEWNRVEWRADSTMNDFIKGGWYDAGDHVKFNLPMAYSAAMLAWGIYQYPDGVKQIGEMQNYVNNLEFALDYLAACDLGDEAVFQVGNGKEDHTWWGPVELYEYGQSENGNDYMNGRPYYSASEGCSAVFGEMSAALAAGALALDKVGGISAAKKADYLKHSENLFKLADTSKSDDVYNKSDAQGFYNSSHFYDELFWASNWLYMATGENSYLTKAKDYIPHLGKELGSDELKYSWAHCWDDVQQGGIVLYAKNSGDDFYVSRAKKHIDNLISNQKKIADSNVVFISEWGCLRYATTCGFLASVVSDTLPVSDTDKAKYKAFYEEQINYTLGDNPLKMSYEIGLTDNYSHNPHHRTAHASWKNDYIKIPATNRHILYGALVGGPNQDGTYSDDRTNYFNNEVTTDYNAGFTALLCKMVSEYGGTTDKNFPEPEERDDEIFVEAMLKDSTPSGVTLSMKLTNHTAWPARIVDNLSYRYYFDASELIKAGYDPTAIEMRVDRDQAKMYGEEYAAEVAKPKQYSGDIYYVEVSYKSGFPMLPISEGHHQCETMLALVCPNYGTGWDASNDYSNEGLDGLEENVKTDKITVYENGKLIYGVEPDGTKPEKTTPVKPVVTTTQPTVEPVITTTTTVTTAPPIADTTPVTTTTVTTVSSADISTAPPVTVTTPQITTSVTTTTYTPIITTSYDRNEPQTPPTTDPVSPAPMSPNDPSTKTDTDLVYGDVDLSGLVELADITRLSKYILNAQSYPLGNGDEASTAKALAQADVTHDGLINALDLSKLIEFNIGKITAAALAK